MVLAANLSLFGQIYAFNEGWGIDHDVTHQILGVFTSHPGLLAYEKRIRDQNYDKPKGDGFGVEGGLKDIKAMLAAGDQVGVSLPFCNVMKEQYATVIANGLKDMDWSALGDASRITAKSPSPTQQKKQ
jgi:3-hydroxyisobutyrate dehydrogenase-like beta-hydroxyacid dehydrogenase